jgi:hypothetical protein
MQHVWFALSIQPAQIEPSKGLLAHNHRNGVTASLALIGRYREAHTRPAVMIAQGLVITTVEMASLIDGIITLVAPSVVSWAHGTISGAEQDPP